MALASSLSAAPPPLTWARPSPSSPAQLPSASAAPSSPASTALLPLAPERHQLVHRRTQIWLHPRSQCLSTAPLPVLVSAASASATPLSARQHWLRSRRWLHRWHLPWRRLHCHPWHCGIDYAPVGQTATSSAALSSASACSARAPAHAVRLWHRRWLRRWLPPWRDGISCAIALGIGIDYALRISCALVGLCLGCALIALNIICNIGLGMRNRVTKYLAGGSILSGIMTLGRGLITSFLGRRLNAQWHVDARVTRQQRDARVES